MLKKLMRGHRWLAVPVAFIAAAGFATTSGALSSVSRTERVCDRLDAKEARQQATLEQATPGTRHYFILQANIAQTERQEANHGCGD